MTLVAGRGAAQGGYKVGVAITMSAGSHTYWKMPGEAGVPPVFTFDGSENVASASVLFPVPRRLTEDGLDAFGYTDSVMFPVRVTALDPAQPTILHADVTYAVCNEICRPEHGTAILRLKPTMTESAATADLVDAAFAQVPKVASSGEMLSITRVAASNHGDEKPAWTLTWRGADPIEDIFAEGPEGFFFTTRKTGSSTWMLVADQVTGHPVDVPVSLTLRQNAGGLVVMEKLDATTPIQ